MKNFRYPCTPQYLYIGGSLNIPGIRADPAEASLDSYTQQQAERFDRFLEWEKLFRPILSTFVRKKVLFVPEERENNRSDFGKKGKDDADDEDGTSNTHLLGCARTEGDRRHFI